MNNKKNNKKNIIQPFIFNQHILPNKNKLYYNPYKYNFNNDTIINILKNIHILQDTPLSNLEIQYIIYNYSYNDNIFQYKTIKELYKIYDLSIFNNINQDNQDNQDNQNNKDNQDNQNNKDNQDNQNNKDNQNNQKILIIIVKNYIILKRLQLYQNYLLIYHKFNLDNNLLITKTIDITRENIINNILKYEQKK